MSRTDKDLPDWVQGARSRRSRESHRCTDSWRHEGRTWSYPAHWPRIECDIDDGHHDGCTRYVPGRSPYAAVPRWFINHRWSAPDRQRARIAAINAVKDHRANGGTDIEPPTVQHRQGATRDWT